MMGGRGSRSKLQATSTPIPMPPQPPPPPSPPPVVPQVDASGFSDTDNAPFHDLYGGAAYYQRQNLDIDARNALQDWLDPNTTPGSLYNFSQNVNYAIQTGQQLNAQQQFAYDSIVDSMHNLGYNVNLTRYDHGGFLDDRLAAAGIAGGRTGLSIAQMKQALVGQTYTDPRILSTSYNDFKNAPSSNPFTNREVRIEYRAKASTQAMMPGNGPGGKLGEILIGPSGINGGHNNYKIVDVKPSGARARPKGGSALTLQQITVVVEVG